MKFRFFLLLFLFPLFSFAQGENDHSLSPYFLINSDSANPAPEFPLKLNAADVTISGVIADVEITQVYINKSQRPLEAVYVFPASTRAAVYAMEMQVGRRVITAEIRERGKARQDYNTAKANGQTASLLEQDRPNIFKMNVANIMPGDSIIVRMSYTELLVPEEGIYEFVYPTVVGPRYTGANGSEFNTPSTNNSATGIPYTRSGIKPLYDFQMKVGIHSPVPFEKIECASHQILLSFEEKNAATVLLSPEEKDGGNRDFVLRYKLSGPAIKTGMMTYEGKDENFFLFMMQPPARVAPDSIPPREYIFVMDVSGSMSGYPIETSKKLMSNLVSGLREDDLFNVVQFAGGSATFSPVSLKANKINIDSALKFIAMPQVGGGTELKAGMERAMHIPRSANYSRTIVIATDGLIAAEASVFRSIHENLDSANVFAFGIGSGVNRYLIEGIAFAGKGEPTVVQYSSQADLAAKKFREYISAPVLTNIHVDFGMMDVYDVEPMHVPDLFAERPILVTGKYKGKPQGTVTVSGITGKKPYKEIIPLEKVKAEKKNKALKYLWARERVTLLNYENSFAGTDSSLIKEITSIGLNYSILTQYTSFIAIYKKERNKEGIADSTIMQPIPVPQNVTDMSIAALGSVSGVQINSLSSVVVCRDITTISDVLLVYRMFNPLFPATNEEGFNSVLYRSMQAQNGSFIPQSVFLFDGGPALSPAFGGRMTQQLPDYMISNFTIDARDGFLNHSLSARHTADMKFSLYNYGTKLYSHVNSAGMQQTGFTMRKRIGGEGPHTKAFYISGSEEYSLFRTDVNRDGFDDLPGRKAANLVAGLDFGISKDAVYRTYRTELIAQLSQQNRNQKSAISPFELKDNLSGIYWFSKFSSRKQEGEETWEYKANLAAGYSQREVNFAGKRFYSEQPFALAEGEYHHDKSRYILIAKACSAWYGGKDILIDGQQFNTGYNLQTANFNFMKERNRFSYTFSLRADLDSRYGSYLSPLVSVRKQFGKNSLMLLAKRLRSQNFSPASMLPALISSRDYSYDRNLLPDDGWQYFFSYNYSRYLFANRADFTVSYLYNDYLRMVIADIDSDPGKISIYNLNKRIGQQQVQVKTGIWFTDHMQLQTYYHFTLRQSIYGEYKLDEPLLPRHQAGLQFAWDKSLRRASSINSIATARFTDRQRIPGHGWSPAYVTFDLKAEYKWAGEKWMVYASAVNILNARQRVSVFGSENPNGSDFDTSLQWGPVVGRVFEIGMNWKIN